METDAGQIIAGAHKYLSAAKELRYSETWAERPTLLQAPTIHLVAHGVELLLKYPLIAVGMSIEDVRKRYGHGLLKLWDEEANAVLRSVILDRANEAWAEAEASGVWPDNDFSGDPGEALTSALRRLDYLHGRDSSFALRYIVPPETLAPRPAFLIDVFGEVAARGVKNPRCLVESW